MTVETLLLAVGRNAENHMEELLETAVETAAPADATVVLAHVFTEEGYQATLENLGFDRERDEIDPDEVAGRHATIREIGDRLDVAGIDYEVVGAVGPVGEAVVRLADEVGADRVIVGGRGRSPTGKAVFGSTSQEILLSAPCPTTFVRAA